MKLQRVWFFVVLGIVLVAVVAAVLTRPQTGPTPTTDLTNDPIIGARHSIGSPEAKVVIVEFFNYLCPICARHSAEIFPLIKRDYIDTGKVRYVFRDYPFAEGSSTREVSIEAAEAAACAADQGRYLEFHELLFRAQRDWNRLQGTELTGYLVQLGGQFGMDPTALRTCMQDNQKQRGIEIDYALAKELQLAGTPAFLVNDRYLNAGLVPYSYWQQELDRRIAAAQ